MAKRNRYEGVCRMADKGRRKKDTCDRLRGRQSVQTDKRTLNFLCVAYLNVVVSNGELRIGNARDNTSGPLSWVKSRWGGK